MKYLEAICIDKGVITLIEEDGEIVSYKQLGIDGLSEREKREFIQDGILAEDIEIYDTIPEDYEIYFEDEEIMGKAERYFIQQRGGDFNV